MRTGRRGWLRGSSASLPKKTQHRRWASVLAAIAVCLGFSVYSAPQAEALTSAQQTDAEAFASRYGINIHWSSSKVCNDGDGGHYGCTNINKFDWSSGKPRPYVEVWKSVPSPIDVVKHEVAHQIISGICGDMTPQIAGSNYEKVTDAYAYLYLSANSKYLYYAGWENYKGVATNIYNNKCGDSWPTARIIPNGDYIIEGVSSGRVVDVLDSSKASGVQLAIYDYNGGKNQIFTFTKLTDNTYTIKNVNSGLMMDVSGGSTSNGAKVIQYPANGTAAQRWRIEQINEWNGLGAVMRLRNVASGKLLDVSGNATANKSVLASYVGNPTSAQMFRLIASPADSSGLPQWRVQLRAMTPGLLVEIPGAKKTAGVQAALYFDNGTLTQQWSTSKVGGAYMLYNANSGLCLDLKGPSSVNKTPIIQYTCNSQANQKWTFNKVDAGATFSMNSVAVGVSKAVDINGAKLANGTLIQIYDVNTSVAQKFRMYVVPL